MYGREPLRTRTEGIVVELESTAQEVHGTERGRRAQRRAPRRAQSAMVETGRELISLGTGSGMGEPDLITSASSPAAVLHMRGGHPTSTVMHEYYNNILISRVCGLFINITVVPDLFRAHIPSHRHSFSAA